MQQELRPTTIVGNWKMHKTIHEARAFIQGLLPIAQSSLSHIWLAVPFTAIYASATEAHGSRIAIGAQNVHDMDEGPYTGEVSGSMIKEAGASFVIVGHSERRSLCHESSRLVNRKAKSVLENGLRPIICIGETLAQQEAGATRDIISIQLTQSLEGFSEAELRKVIIAYEPVWAIGTGKIATPALAQDIHSFCRQVISNIWNHDTAQEVSILYGGSVKPDNAAELIREKDIDGLLVGGSSLSLESFCRIIEFCNNNIS